MATYRDLPETGLSYADIVALARTGDRAAMNFLKDSDLQDMADAGDAVAAEMLQNKTRQRMDATSGRDLVALAEDGNEMAYQILSRRFQHNLDMSTGRAALFTVGKPAWMRLGTTVANAQTSSEAIKLAGQNWLVEQGPLTATKGEGTLASVITHVANVRSDTGAILGIVGKNYTPLQNHEAYSFMDELVRSKLAMYETAGSLNGGKQVWILARIPGSYYAARSDEILPYVLLCNGHDGSMAVRMMATTVRVVCNNTLNLALNDAQKAGKFALTVRHSQKIKGKIEEARQNLGLITDRLERFEAQARAMAQRELKTVEVHEVLAKLFPIKLKVKEKKQAMQVSALEAAIAATEQTMELSRELIAEHMADLDRASQYNAKALEMILGNLEDHESPTAWGVYNSVSEWADHQKRFAGKTQEAKDNNQLKSIWFGSSNDIKQEAWRATLGLVA